MRVLPDTNIWVKHLIEKNHLLCEILEYNFMVMHPLVIGELAVADYPFRKPLLDDLKVMPMTYEVTFEETLHFISERVLYSKGIQWNDAVILASVVITGDTVLWTRDRRLREIAENLGVAYNAI